MDTRRTRGVRAVGAFTLIELLVVIAIISVLTAIFLPVVNTARERGQQVSCTHVLKHMMAGFMSYAQENNQHYPPYVIGGLPYSSGTNFLKWQHLLGPYLGLPAGDQGGSDDWKLILNTANPKTGAYPADHPFVCRGGLGKLASNNTLGRITGFYRMNTFGGPQGPHPIPTMIIDRPDRAVLAFCWWHEFGEQSGCMASPADTHRNGRPALFCDGHILNTMPTAFRNGTTNDMWSQLFLGYSDE